MLPTLLVLHLLMQLPLQNLYMSPLYFTMTSSSSTTLASTISSFLLLLLLSTTTLGITNALASAATPMRSFLVTGANKGQGLALCKRILSEHVDTHVYLCSRDVQRGREAKDKLSSELDGCDAERVEVLQLDVTSDISVQDAMKTVQLSLGEGQRLSGVVSNAGVLWGYPLPELMEVCAVGVQVF